MTDKEIKTTIKLYNPENDRDKKIIELKGNTKCIFYSDDECRKGDRTRDCINCARIEYQSLYSLNWDNQVNLQKQLKLKEQECKNLKKDLEAKKYHWEKATEEILKGTQQIVDRMNKAESEVQHLKKQAHCYSCGTCKGREDYKNVARHCENVINSLHKEQKKLDHCKQAMDKIRYSIIRPYCDACMKQTIECYCDNCKIMAIVDLIDEVLN